jgi:O-antigen/teichoic acid export membrane protein
VILLREFAARYREPVIRADALWSAIGFSAQIAIGGIVAIAIGRQFGPEVKGYSSLLTIGPSIVAWMLAMGIGPATMYFATSRRIAASELLTGASVLAVVFGAFAAVIGWIALRPSVDSPEVVFALGIGLVLTIVQLLREYHGAALLGLRHVALYAQTAIVARAAGAVLLIAAVYLAPLPIFYVMIPVSFAVSNLVVVGAVLRTVRWRWRWSRAALERQVRFGVHSAPGDAVVVGLLRFDQFAVYLLLGPVALGLYSVGALCADFLAQAGQAAANLFFARVSAAGPRAPYLARLAVGASAIGLLALAVPLVVLADRIIIGFFGQGFEGAIGSWRILAFAGVVEGTSRVAVIALRALGSPLRASVMNLGGLLVNVPLVLTLGPRYGLEGVAIATLVAHGVVAIGAYLAFRSTSTGAASSIP